MYLFLDHFLLLIPSIKQLWEIINVGNKKDVIEVGKLPSFYNNFRSALTLILDNLGQVDRKLFGPLRKILSGAITFE